MALSAPSLPVKLKLFHGINRTPAFMPTILALKTARKTLPRCCLFSWTNSAQNGPSIPPHLMNSYRAINLRFVAASFTHASLFVQMQESIENLDLIFQSLILSVFTCAIEVWGCPFYTKYLTRIDKLFAMCYKLGYC